MMLPVRLLPLVLATALAALPAHPVAAQRFEENPWWHRRVLHIAHAGGECEAPTNTLYAFKKALAKGADMLEFDVHSSADGVLVVIHDDTVDRVTNGSGRVDAMTLEELKSLDKAYDYTPHAGPGCADDAPGLHPFRGVATGDVPPPEGFEADDFRIAAVREVLETFPDVLMSIEIKGAPPGALDTAARLAALLREFGRSDDVLVASFDDAVIDHFKAHAPEIHTTPGTMGVVAFLFGVPIPEHQALQVPPTFGGLSLLSPAILDHVRAQGMPLIVFLQEGTEFESMYDELLDVGVDGVITGRPRAFEARLRERGLAFEVPVGIAAAGAQVERQNRVPVPLTCPFWAGSPSCSGRLWLEWTPPLAPGAQPWLLTRPRDFAVARGQMAELRPQLSPLTRLLLRWLGPLEAHVRVTPGGPLDAPTAAPFLLEPPGSGRPDPP